MRSPPSRHQLSKTGGDALSVPAAGRTPETPSLGGFWALCRLHNRLVCRRRAKLRTSTFPILDKSEDRCTFLRRALFGSHEDRVRIGGWIHLHSQLPVVFCSIPEQEGCRPLAVIVYEYVPPFAIVISAFRGR